MSRGFTLGVVPVVYTLLDGFVNRLRRGRANYALRVVHAGPAVKGALEVVRRLAA